MGTCFLYGNGGDGNERNIFVKAYASKNALLEDAPKSNTIGVVTSVNIYAMAIQPSVPGNTEGNVWVKDNATAWQKPVIQTIASKSSPKIYVPVFPSECSQYVSGKWVKKAAYLYQSGEWTQFSEEFKATIKVTYPSGSTCTATNGNTKLTAPNTSGTWTCVVPNTGKWTIKSVKGSQSASKTVSITTEGQSASVKISYTYYIFNGGNNVDYTGGWTGSGSYTGDVLSVSNGSDSGWIQNRNIASAVKIDMAPYSVLHFAVSTYNDSSKFGLSTNTTDGDYSTVQETVSSVKEYAIDISGLTGSYYVKMGSTGKQASGSSWTNIGYAVNKIWLT